MLSPNSIPKIVGSTLLAPRTRSFSKSGFTLVEVVLALGIISFTLITMLGLLGNGLAAVHTSTNASIVSEIVQQIRTNLDKSTRAMLTSQSTATTNYFDNQGLLLASSGPAPAGTVYAGVLSAPTTPSASYFSGQGAAQQLYEVTVTINLMPGGNSTSATSLSQTAILISPID
jgi:uncharacterized protein (TIGR02598 family)